MLTLTPEQFRILSLPDPCQFAPRLAEEIRRDHAQQVAGFDEPALVRETMRSYAHAGEVLRITRLATLVAWVKADVAWAKGLRREIGIDLRVRTSPDPSLTAQDILSGLTVAAAWPKEGV